MFRRGARSDAPPASVSEVEDTWGGHGTGGHGELRRLTADREEATVMGKAAREAALSRYGLARFLSDWDALLDEVA